MIQLNKSFTNRGNLSCQFGFLFLGYSSQQWHRYLFDLTFRLQLKSLPQISSHPGPKALFLY